MQNLKFNIENANILKEVSDEQLAIAEVYICHDGNNAHGMPISLDTIKEASHTLLNKFLVADYDGYDFLDHTKTQKILGFFPAENDLRYVEKNGKTYFVADVIISKVYAPYAYDMFLSGNYKSVSMEIGVLEKELIDGLEHITKFVFMGVTILGDDVNPACPDSNIQITKFSKDEFIDNGNLAYTQFAEHKVTDFPKKGDNEKITLKNSKFPQFDHKFAMDIKEKYPKVWKKGGNIRGNEAFEYWHKYHNDDISQGVLDWIKEREAWMARHEKDFRINGVIALIKWGGISTKGESYMKELVRDEVKKLYNEDFSIDEEDLGKSESITIDNSKDSAIMSDTWTGQDADFLNKLLKASNRKELLSEAYLIVDDMENASVNEVHYPHHSLKEGKLVINEKGVVSAFARAKQQGLTGEPLNHLKRHYEELGLSIENFNEGGIPLDKKMMMEKMAQMESMMKYEMLDMDEDCIYVIDKEEKIMYMIPYKMAEEECSFAMEDMKQAKMACKYEAMGEDEDKDADNDVYMAISKIVKAKGLEFSATTSEKREILNAMYAKNCEAEWFYVRDFDDSFVYIAIENELFRYDYDSETYEIDLNTKTAVRESIRYLEFNDDQNIEAVAQEEENAKETDKMKEEVAEGKKEEMADMDMMKTMADKMAKMEEDMAKMAEANAELNKFKEEVEMAETKSKVDMESQLMEEKVNKEFADTWRGRVEEFANVDAWKNAMKAEAFSIVIEKKAPEKKSFSRMDIPNLHEDKKDENNTKKFWE